jgi:hypothetical protein
MAQDDDMNVRPTLTRMMIRHPDPRTRRIAPSCFRSWTRARLAIFEPDGGESGPSRSVASNEALAAACSRAPTTHALP